MRTDKDPVSKIDVPKRRSPGRPRVPLARIIDMALSIIDEDGAEALSMRSLARRLNTGTATLYRAVANRDELIAHVVDRVFGEMKLPPSALEGKDWQDACTIAAQVGFNILRRHLNVAPLLIERVPTGPHAMLMRERFLALLLDNGFKPKAAARAYATIVRFVIGFAVQIRGAENPEELETEEITALYQRLDPEQFPATFRVADVLPTATLEEEFQFGLRLIVAGLSELRGSS